ncbi:MAG: hypothetical protein ACOWWM_20830 [Desulfobacterales bacterium]
MARKKKVNGKELIKAIADGMPQNEVMEKFGFKNSSQLKVAYTNALMMEGKIPELKKGTAKRAAAGPRTITVNKRGSLIVPKNMVEDFGLKEGATFQVKKTKSGITLKFA